MIKHNFILPKRVFLFCLSTAVLMCTSCFDDQIDLPDQTLQGKIDGFDWSYSGAGAFLFNTNQLYQFRFVSASELSSDGDACTIPSPSQPHVSMLFRPQIGSFSVPLAGINEQVRIHFSPSSSILVNSGFLEIFDINNGRIFGYLQAVVDEETTVEGSFVASLCN